jgi:hypothetical protein
MQRILVEVKNQEEWYAVVREANRWFGTGNWRGQRRVRRQLRPASRYPATFGWMVETKKIWFDVPDIKFASWIKVKYTLPVELVNQGNNSEVAE